MIEQGHDVISTTPVAACFLCGSIGNYLYLNLKDRLFGTLGYWNLKQCSNPNCRLAWLDPMPTVEDIGKAYKNYYTHGNVTEQRTSQAQISKLKKVYDFLKAGYWAKAFGYPTASCYTQKLLGSIFYLLPFYKAGLDRMVMGLRCNYGGRLLEVGCGSGGMLARLSTGWQVEGIEVDLLAVKQARAKGLTVHAGNLEDQRYPDDHFDAITMNHVIEHIHNPIHLLSECRRILRPKGNLIITTPNLESWGHKLFGKSNMQLDPPRHLYIHNLHSLQAMAMQVKFTIRSIRTSAAVFAPLIFIGSRAIASTGVFKMDSSVNFRERFLSHIFSWIEWGILNFKPTLGEELILVVEK